MPPPLPIHANAVYELLEVIHQACVEARHVIETRGGIDEFIVRAHLDPIAETLADFDNSLGLAALEVESPRKVRAHLSPDQIRLDAQKARSQARAKAPTRKERTDATAHA